MRDSIIGRKTEGAQIDLLIDRKDNTINLCEMKFCESVYELKADEQMDKAKKFSRFRNIRVYLFCIAIEKI